jgi:hypothetical protein
MQPPPVDQKEVQNIPAGAITETEAVGKLKARKVTKTSSCDCCTNITLFASAYLAPLAMSACSNGVCTIHPVTQYVILPTIIGAIVLIAKKTIECCSSLRKQKIN